jgi:hypothetical protein
MSTTRTLRNLAFALVAGSLLASTGQALEADLPWDQADATKLAVDLSAAVDGLIAQARIEDRAMGFSPKSLENYLLIEDLKQLKRYARVLAAQLEAEQGRAETEKLFRRIQRLAREAAVAKRATPILEGAQHEIDKTEQILDDLAGYYESRKAPVAAPPPEKPATA